MLYLHTKQVSPEGNDVIHCVCRYSTDILQSVLLPLHAEVCGIYGVCTCVCSVLPLYVLLPVYVCRLRTTCVHNRAPWCVCAAQPRAMEAISSLPSWCSRLPAVAMHAHTREQPAPCTVHPTTLIEPYTMSYGWCSRLPAGPRAPTKHLNPRAECTQLGCRAEFRAPHS